MILPKTAFNQSHLLTQEMNDRLLSRRQVEHADRLADDPEPEVLVDRLAHLQLADHEVKKIGRAVSDADADHPRCLLKRFQK